MILCSDLHGFNSAVLDFTMELVQTGVENDVVLALVVFSFQYVLVNHEYWKYKLKHARWKVTLKVPLGIPLRKKQEFCSVFQFVGFSVTIDIKNCLGKLCNN